MTAKDRHTAAILAALQSGPMDTKAIIAATGLHGTTLGNVIRGMLKDGLVSRTEVTTGRWRYYLGQTAPASPPRAKRAPKTALRYQVPVRQIEVHRHTEYSRNSSANTQIMKITLPAEPWL